MFYLTHFFKTFMISPFKTSVLVIVSFMLVLTAFFAQNINLILEREMNQKEKPHFYALLENASQYDGIIPQIKSLPGVESIKFENHDEMQALLKETAKQLGVDDSVLEEVISGQYIGLKINFYPETSKIRLDEAREQIQSIFGAENTTLTPLKMPQTSMVQNYLSQMGAQILILIFILLWLLILFSWAEVARKQAYLIEQFQRKKQVCFKLVLSGLLFCTFVAAAPSFYFVRPSLPELITVIVFFILGASFFLRAWKWQEQ